MGKGEGKSRRGINDDTARKIETGLKKPLGWMDDDGEVAGDLVVARHETPEGYLRFQVMGEGGAGPGVINPEHPEVLREVEIAEWQLRKELGRIPSPDRVKLLTVRGNSMAPRIKSGDVVFVDMNDREPFDGGLFVVILHGHALVKRIEIRTDGLHIVSLASPERPDIVPPERMGEVQIAGRVLGAIQLRRSDDL
jgi:phage repressor protein C with HTH and peptisase S24 domain